ncbi:MAG: hypothetical protein KME12_08890 [Trichocoleus desertorum ATA4-8-CV12]|jgi:hypothetical protein|nr:hypothetical protein [Trichocoleus desertorum ATA4-8-CV12]
MSYSSDRTSPQSQTIHEPPFVEINGLLFYKEEGKTPEFLDASFSTTLFDERVIVDHLVMLFSSALALNQYSDRLIQYGAQAVEGPGIWPQDFCPGLTSFPDDLTMYFLSVLMPSGGIVVLAAPHTPHDQLDRLIQERGLNTVHHVALHTNDINSAAEICQRKGFVPLSTVPQDDGCLCQWSFKNLAGQIIELIHRRCTDGATFSCQNIAALRLTEET